MKKILLTIALTGLSVPLFANTATPTSGTTYPAGTPTTTPTVVTANSMTFGNFASNTALGTGAIPIGGNFYASDYSLSIWLNTSSITSTTTLFGYYGTDPNGGGGYGANALVLNTDGTLTLGDGKLDTSTGAFTNQRGSTSAGTIALGGVSGGLVNLTLSVVGADGSQTATIYYNGNQLETLSSYNGNMNGSVSQPNMNSYLNPNLIYGTVLTQDGTLTAGQVAGFAGLAAVPEPSTFVLVGIFGMGILFLFRRRRIA